MVDVGSGVPVVLVPGVQGRWEWMAPAVEALAARCRVITESLPGDAGSLAPLNPNLGFDQHVDWLDALLAKAKLEHAAVCGVSYGGLIALRYAAARPERTMALALVSTPSPTWKPNCQIDWYLRAPRLLSPAFALSSPLRLYPEIARAFPDLFRRGAFGAQHLWRVITHPFRPTRMAQRVRLLETANFAEDCPQVSAPTLVVTGEAGLDRVVEVDSTRHYVRAIADAAYVQIGDTGHIGLVTRPREFADVVASFVTAHAARSTSSTGPTMLLPA